MVKSDLVNLLKTWDLSPDSRDILQEYPDLVESLQLDRDLPNFREDYTPTLIEFYLNDRFYGSISNGQLQELVDYKSLNKSIFLEIKFDGECALFLCKGEAVVNRISAQVIFDEILNHSGVNKK